MEEQKSKLQIRSMSSLLLSPLSMMIAMAVDGAMAMTMQPRARGVKASARRVLLPWRRFPLPWQRLQCPCDQSQRGVLTFDGSEARQQRELGLSKKCHQI
tara:strand:+ start:173 stop:472 length:300 start_codon:yes stop_codon:yes gene_type:complete